MQSEVVNIEIRKIVNSEFWQASVKSDTHSVKAEGETVRDAVAKLFREVRMKNLSWDLLTVVKEV